MTKNYSLKQIIVRINNLPLYLSILLKILSIAFDSWTKA